MRWTLICQALRKDELSLELKDGYLVISAAKGLDKDEKEKKTGQICPPGALCRQHEPIFLCRRGCKKQEDIHAKYESRGIETEHSKGRNKEAGG